MLLIVESEQTIVCQLLVCFEQLLGKIIYLSDCSLPQNHNLNLNTSKDCIMSSIAQGKYRLDCQIGFGSFGKVFADRQFAIKQIKLPLGQGRQRASISALLANEIGILTKLNHPNIVKVYEVIEEVQAVYIVMELCEGDLRRWTDVGGCGEKKAISLMRQVVRGYAELARIGIVHRDLKPANILLGKGIAKLADFGMARYVANESLLLRSHVGTPYYMAPQLLQRIEYSRKCDIWSLGVILYELIFGQVPWHGKNETLILENIMSRPLTFPLPISLAAKDILSRMLAISESQRASLEEVEKLLELYEEGDVQRQDRTYHWTVVKRLLMHEADHLSQLQFGRSFSELKAEESEEVKGDVKSLLRAQEAYLLDYLSLWRQN